MKWLDDIVKRIKTSDNWACRDWIGASEVIGRVSNGADDTVVDLVGCLIDEIERLTKLLDCRAGKLLRKGKFFLVVANDEPYFTNVYTLIRDNEKRHGRWNGRWTDADEEMWLREYGGQWVPRSQEEDNNHER